MAKLTKDEVIAALTEKGIPFGQDEGYNSLYAKLRSPQPQADAPERPPSVPIDRIPEQLRRYVNTHQQFRSGLDDEQLATGQMLAKQLNFTVLD